MARYGLENDTIRIEIDSHGAELKSLVKKETGRNICGVQIRNTGVEPRLSCSRL